MGFSKITVDMKGLQQTVQKFDQNIPFLHNTGRMTVEQISG